MKFMKREKDEFSLRNNNNFIGEENECQKRNISFFD